MNATYISKDQNWQSEQTIYWFDVCGEEYGVSEQAGEEPKVLDCDGCPVNTDDGKNAELACLPDFVTDEMRSE